MDTKLVVLLLATQLNLLFASDYHVVPTLNVSIGDERPRLQQNHDRVVPQINLSPLGVHHDPVVTDNEDDLTRREKFPLVVELEESGKFKDLAEKEEYPTPRPRIQEIEEKADPKTPIPTPRPRIIESNEVLDKSLPSYLKNDESNVVRDDPKPFNLAHNQSPAKVDLPTSVDNTKTDANGQPEVILVIQDVDSTEEYLSKENDTLKEDPEQDREVSTETIQRYIDEIDQAYKGKLIQRSSLREKLFDPGFSFRKSVIKDGDINDPFVGRPRREAPKEAKPSVPSQTPNSDKIPAVGGEKISNERKTSGGVSYNVGFEPAKASKPPLIISNSRRIKRDGGKVANERKTSGGLSYNVNFEPAKGAKPQLSSGSRTKREGARPMQIADLNKADELPKVTIDRDHSLLDHKSLSSEDSSSASHSSEMVHPDPQLPKLDLPTDEDKTFSEVLHKAVKDHQKMEQHDNNNSNVYTQDVQRLPHRGPTIKNPFLAIDPPVSSEEKTNETKDEDKPVGIIVVEKTVVLEDDDQDRNKTQNVFIENADVNVNLINAELGDEEEGSFWQNGFTIGLHISPLALCLGSALILLALLMRLALKMYKKRLEASMVSPVAYNAQKKSAQFDDVSLQTVSTA